MEPGGPLTLKVETLRLRMKAWRICRLVVADSHHLHEEQDSDPNWIENLDPDPNWSEKLDPDPH